MDLDDRTFKMIGSCNCLITGVRLQPTVRLHCRSDYNFADSILQNTAVYGPITFEEIVIVMIKTVVNVKRIEGNRSLQIVMVAFYLLTEIIISLGNEELEIHDGCDINPGSPLACSSDFMTDGYS